MCLFILRRAPHRLLQGGRRLLQPVRQPQRKTEIIVQVRQTRLQPQRLAVRRDSLLRPAEIAQHVTHRLIRLGAAALMPQSFLAGSQRGV